MTTVKKNILNLIIFRLIIVTTLLVAAVVIQLSTAVFLPLGPFYVIILIAYAACLGFLLLYIGDNHYNGQAYAQILADLLLITILAYISGGLGGHLYVLYIFPILAAGLVLPGGAAYLTASLAAILLGFMADGMHYGLIPYFREDQARESSAGLVLYTIFLAWGLFFAIAFLSAHSGAGLRKTRAALNRAERELGIKARLAEAGQMSALIAHEIRNPLAAISGAVQVLKSELKPEGESAQLMDIVLRESRRVSATIEQFLSLASPGPQEFLEFNLGAVVEETVMMLRLSGEIGEAIRVEGNFNDSPIVAYGNPSQFKQIVWNLVRNAVSAMPDGGRLGIDLSRKREGSLALSVIDSGRGMSPDEKARVFEPFYSSFAGGRGLGLTVVRRIVDDYDGTIEVRSELGRGTEFLITLPSRPAPARRKE
jgi:two-component system sensor histidine kinase PilS (NtrC family)